MRKFAAIGALAALLAAFAGPAPSAPPIPRRSPSWSSRRRRSARCFPSVIKQQKFDIANGIDITFVERPPDAYAAEFNAGEFQVGGSASVLILGLGATRGIKTSYLFNLFDYWGTVVTSRPDIKTLADLAGKQTGRRQGHHQLHDVRVAGEAAGRRPQFVPGDQHRDRRALSAMPSPSAPTRCSCGSRPILW